MMQVTSDNDRFPHQINKLTIKNVFMGLISRVSSQEKQFFYDIKKILH